MAGTVLYIIDMQPLFSASLEIIAETKREIRLAKRRKDFIVFVELGPISKRDTIPSLLRAAHFGGYNKIRYCTKQGGDGSKEFFTLMKDVPVKRVRVCGVNRDACVQSTVGGFIRHNITSTKPIQIEVGKAATASDGYNKKWNNDGYTEKVYATLAKENKIVLKP